jgi:hypothetical protein
VRWLFPKRSWLSRLHTNVLDFFDPPGRSRPLEIKGNRSPLVAVLNPVSHEASVTLIGKYDAGRARLVGYRLF